MFFPYLIIKGVQQMPSLWRNKFTSLPLRPRAPGHSMLGWHVHDASPPALLSSLGLGLKPKNDLYTLMKFIYQHHFMYSSSHNHGSGKWVPPILVSFHLGWFSTSMIMGERVFTINHFMYILCIHSFTIKINCSWICKFNRKRVRKP